MGSDGIIVLEALFDYAAPDEIVGGMKKLGLDISKVKYVIIFSAGFADSAERAGEGAIDSLRKIPDAIGGIFK